MKAPPHFLSALQAAAAIEAGALTAEKLTKSCLERIAERDADVRAFAALDAQLALEQARAADRGTAGGVLRGLPFAVKDVIDTAEHDTAFGSVIHAAWRPRVDAACVALTRAQGAIVAGKAVTSEFATQTPGPTRNPLALAHTPGGSSSGSAAAVADGMVPLAFGTQTTGSIVRPAAYCGVVGYKPTFGAIPAAGVKPLSPSNDTVGVLARDVADAAFFASGLHGARHVPQAAARPRIALCLSSQWSHLAPAAARAIDRFAAALERAGAVVGRLELPAEFEAAIALQSRIVACEARQNLAAERLQHAGHLSARLLARLDEAADTTVDEYLDMLRHAALLRQRIGALFDHSDALLYPAADGEAEAGLANSGSPRFGALWTLAHLPCVALPIGRGPAGLPLGAQLVGRHGDDARLLAIARFAEGASEYERTFA